MELHAGIDTGGTFTDLVALDATEGTLRALKTSSRPDKPGRAITTALADAGISGEGLLRFTHGTTVGTNTLIERTGCRVGLLTTQGFEDMPYIQRINRKVLYDLSWTKPKPLVATRRACLGVIERLSAGGEVVRAVDEDQVRELCAELREHDIEAVAICLLFSYAHTEHEQIVKRIIEEELGEIPVSVSHEVAPIWREYERSNTTVADAYLKPLMRRYVTSLSEELVRYGMTRSWTIMKSNGGAMLSAAAATSPIQTVMSGPAGGMIAAERVAAREGIANVITLDMGGTSADVGLIVDGQQRHTTEYEIEWGLPASVPVIDIKSIGAGGGSVAWVDRGGFLRVGPRSAGAQPGPACYGRGGEEATVTDANLLLGRLDPGYFLGGRMSLDLDLARAAIEGLAGELDMEPLELAASIVEIANENMANAIKMVSLERGHDPAPLHAARVRRRRSAARGRGRPLARRSRACIDPALPRRVLGRRAATRRPARRQGLDEGVPLDRRRCQRSAVAVRRITERAVAELRQEGFERRAADRAARSTCAISARTTSTRSSCPTERSPSEALADAFARFAAMHEERYGYAIEGETIELVSFKVTAIGARPPVRLVDTPPEHVREPAPPRGLLPWSGVRGRRARTPLDARAGEGPARACAGRRRTARRRSCRPG